MRTGTASPRRRCSCGARAQGEEKEKLARIPFFGTARRTAHSLSSGGGRRAHPCVRARRRVWSQKGQIHGHRACMAGEWKELDASKQVTPCLPPVTAVRLTLPPMI